LRDEKKGGSGISMKKKEVGYDKQRMGGGAVRRNPIGVQKWKRVGLETPYLLSGRLKEL